MLVENTLWGTVDKIQMAIERLRQFEPPEGLHVAFSGGKDSQCILDLCERAGVRFDAHYQQAMEPPELIHFIKEHYPQVQVHRPVKSMWELVVANALPPTRIVRYCCDELKEQGGAGRVVVTGIRWAESNRRAKRQMVEACLRDKRKTYLHPIIDWTEADVWEYHRWASLPHCSLYDEGWRRIGCVLCPMAGKAGMAKDIARWPKIAESYRRACRRAFARRQARGDTMQWQSGDDMFDWWVSGAGCKHDEAQPVLFE